MKTRRVQWQSPCGLIVIISHFGELYELFYRGKAVMPPASFAAVAGYVWAEFLDW